MERIPMVLAIMLGLMVVPVCAEEDADAGTGLHGLSLSIDRGEEEISRQERVLADQARVLAAHRETLRQQRRRVELLLRPNAGSPVSWNYDTRFAETFGRGPLGGTHNAWAFAPALEMPQPRLVRWMPVETEGEAGPVRRLARHLLGSSWRRIDPDALDVVAATIGNRGATGDQMALRNSMPK